MLIRCERCSTLYELDEALLAPEGSAVQCTRCQHVFTARPPEAARPAASPAPPPEPPAMTPPPAPPAPEPEAEPEPPRAAPRAYAPEPPRAVRSGPTVYKPQPTQAAVTRAPVLRKDTVGTFEARLRWSARRKWLIPLVVAAVAVVVAAGWLLLSRRHAPEAGRLRAEGLALMALDDATSLDQARARFEEALRLAPRDRVPEADLAAAEILRAAELGEGASALQLRAAARAAERDRL
ncbi:zinc-ribbon domain-containing protein, partial [Anaeromyxobacter sp. PSR-1]|uniref:zinc-ribbon domain-containing protein n=2 Tax=unclassified Anaeromyxobacter TaxID=2620896 RepID=UPI0018728C16